MARQSDGCDPQPPKFKLRHYQDRRKAVLPAAGDEVAHSYNSTISRLHP